MPEYLPKPSDKERADAFQQIAELAKDNGLILNAYGGVITVVHPDTQKEKDIESRILFAAGMGPFPNPKPHDS